MKISELSDPELERALAATVNAVGPDSIEVRALRREVARRRWDRDTLFDLDICEPATKPAGGRG